MDGMTILYECRSSIIKPLYFTFSRTFELGHGLDVNAKY